MGWVKYTNGNYIVKFNTENGTKIRMTNDEIFKPAFAENCDCLITKRCDGGCQFCYEGCTTMGKHGDILNAKFLDTLHPYTELAINGNDLTHPDLIPFLEKLKKKNIIVNMTVNQIHFEVKEDFIKELLDKKLIYGLGVSLRSPTKKFIEKIKNYPTAVIHTINGILTKEDFNALKNNGLRVLVLGYKDLRRGVDYHDSNRSEIENNQNWLSNNLNDFINGFDTVSFDNLGLSQLPVKDLMTEEEWESFYMGDDGGYTFYLDLVENTFAKNSVSMKRYPIMDNIDDMFNVILKESN